MLRSGISTGASWFVAFLAVSSICNGAFSKEDIRKSCHDREVLSRNIADEVRGYAPVINSIINEVVHGSERNKTYEELAFFVDTFGTRFTGTRALERSINYMVKLLKRRRLDNVHTEPVKVPRWVRGTEEAWMMTPRLKKLPILGLGYSSATPRRGITAPILVVDSFEELRKNRQKDFETQVVIVGGHIDSWDVGQGAMDDGGGAFISWRALDVLRQLGLRPRRTVRSVLWTAEEMELIGAAQYFKDHGDERKERVNIAMESDMGTFKPMGLAFSGHSEQAKCVIAEVLSLFSDINATELRIGADAPDLEQWISAGFPVASLTTDNRKYFYFHHTDGDTMTVQDPIILDLCTALWAGVAYVLADLQDSLPRR
ncbi:hypothetical protein HPB49_001441 [Dermacentor silvarum]|uniref:Uncharacterized protein n=1 Tax=Dermacentor silvarum TaxID=543639 RepID=A0ACB8D1L7_DERSI|nr:hypothetical protein HPB49_001441 [Dermacentor silvarum]